MNNFFYHSLFKVLAENWNNDFKDNFDFFRFGEPEREIVNSRENLTDIETYLDKLDSFFNLLEDDRSRDIMIRVLAFRMLGHRKIRLPFSHPDYWRAISNLDSLMDKNSSLEVPYTRITTKLYSVDLNSLGIPLKLYAKPSGILSQFLIKQYEYITDEKEIIGAKAGDIIIDGGACWGDTALFFADKVKEQGKVYAFEFIPDNLKTAHKNFSLNPSQEKIIKLIESPLWEKSNVKMFFDDNGPGSKIAQQPFKNEKKEIKTISIDDFVREEKLTNVNFIKMDIEGAEQPALKGAVRTLKKHKPQLAISIYHNMNDFANVVHLINDMNLGYKFYLNHFTIHREETVLYAKI